MYASDILNLTFFPIGAILTFSTTAWSATSAEFKTIWKICDGQNGTPNLVNKFLRGGSSSGATGDGRKTLSQQEIPAHQHTGTTNDAPHAHTFNSCSDFMGTYVNSGNYVVTHVTPDSGTAIITTNAGGGSHTHSFTTNPVGNGQAFDVIPAFYTVIYIMKIA
jgi:hypothetical protein